MKRESSPRCGFALIEVLVSLAIYSLLISSLAYIQFSSIDDAYDASQIRKIETLSQSKMGEILSGIEQETSGVFLGQDGEPLPGYAWTTEKQLMEFYADPDDESLSLNTDLELDEKVEEKKKIQLVKIILVVTFKGSEEEPSEPVFDRDGNEIKNPANEFILVALRDLKEDEDVEELRDATPTEEE